MEHNEHAHECRVHRSTVTGRMVGAALVAGGVGALVLAKLVVSAFALLVAS